MLCYFSQGLTEKSIRQADDIFEAMSFGEKVRRYGETKMNDHSSRSHTIFRIIIESCDKVEDESGHEENIGTAVKVSHLNLVDLAGSERAAQTGAVGSQLKEGTNL